KDEVNFKGDLPAFFAELRDNKDNPVYYYPDTDAGRQAYLDDSTAAINKIKLGKIVVVKTLSPPI
ncbi:MAG: hypothetical protein Q8P39_02290, partial [Candidatus Yanofskybacteria bacterium]|nr:hypothetical protein [Candidatus Yanofskybacteria bacterium]